MSTYNKLIFLGGGLKKIVGWRLYQLPGILSMFPMRWLYPV